MDNDIVPIERFLAQVWDCLAVFTTGIICAVVYTAIKFGTDAVFASDENFVPVAMRISVVASLLAPLVFHPVRLSRLENDWSSLIGQLTFQVGVLFSLLLGIGFLTRALIYVPRQWAVMWSIAIFVSVAGGRALLPHVVYRAIPHSLLRQKIVVAGKRAVADRVILHLRRGRDDVEVVNVFYEADRAGSIGSYIPDLVEYGRRHPVDRILLALDEVTSPDLLHEAVYRLKALNADIALCPYLIDAVDVRLAAENLGGGVPVVLLARRPLGRWALFVKTAEDKVLAATLLLVILPLMIIIALTIRLDSPGPVLFRQRRHGLNNAEFEILKFRTMSSTTSQPDAVLLQTQPHDVRVTRVGHFLRRSSLDELPQLINVLRGEMSLVGPRPHPTAMRTENQLGSEIVAEYPHRHRVKPGMTGWAQINGYRGATHTTDQVKHRVDHDMFYIENWSILLDLKILALTPIRMILNNDNAY